MTAAGESRQISGKRLLKVALAKGWPSLYNIHIRAEKARAGVAQW